MPAKREEKSDREGSKNRCGRRIRLARERFPGGLTQDQLSGRVAALGVVVDRPAIAKIELGLRKVSDFEVVAFARALKVDAVWLLGIEA